MAKIPTEKQQRLVDAFLAFRDAVYGSSASKEEKNDIWKKFLAIYTGQV